MAEAGDAAQHHADRNPALRELLEHRLGQEPTAAALPFGEVGGELQRIHSAPANDWPAAAAAMPSTTLMTTLATAGPIWRSSVSR